MGSRERLRVPVNDELVLDAGECEEVVRPDGRERIVHPPPTTLFHQVLDYLHTKPDPERRPSGTIVGREGVAAAALTLRWGSYFAVLVDRAKPLWRAVRSAAVSRISDDEMARINIEASAAMAHWIDLSRTTPAEYARLVERAVTYLPMPRRTSKPRPGPFWALSDPQVARRLAQATDAERLARTQAEVERHPSRVLANALVNVAWRNGPVETIHAGDARGYPLGERRLTPAEERVLMRFASDGMAMGMTVCLRLASATRKLEMAGVLWTGGFVVEAAAPAREAVELALVAVAVRHRLVPDGDTGSVTETLLCGPMLVRAFVDGRDVELVRRLRAGAEAPDPHALLDQRRPAAASRRECTRVRRVERHRLPPAPVLG